MLILILQTSLAAADSHRTKFPKEVISGINALTCQRVSTPPVLDGEVDNDPVWQKIAKSSGAWVQLGTSTKSKRQTVVATCYDDQHIYVAFICEERNLGQVTMDGNLHAGDSVEVVFEVGGLKGKGKTFAFRANELKKDLSWGFARPNATQVGPWEKSFKYGPNRWMVEMKIPFSTLRRDLKKDSPPPQRGDLYGVKFVRYGTPPKDGSTRLISTYNIEIPFEVVYICGYNLKLYFDAANVISPDTAAWKKQGTVSFADNTITMAKDSSITQTLKVHPNSFYQIECTSTGAVSYAHGDSNISMKKNTGGFWTDENEKEMKLTITSSAESTISNLSVLYQPGERKSSSLCLTNNSSREVQNLRSLSPNAPMGSYRYVTLDDSDRFLEEDHPDFRNRGWKYDNAYVIPDVGGMKGWIPFNKGSLTGDPSIAFWKTAAPYNTYYTNAYGRHAKTVVEIDLGKNYFVTDLEILWPAPYSTNVELFGKAESDDAWHYLHTSNGEFVKPSQRDGKMKGFDHISNIQSVVRYIRWRGHSPDVFYPQRPVMDGIQEMWVWGTELGDRDPTTKKLFTPWIDDTKIERKEPIVFNQDAKRSLIFPRPRERTDHQGWFSVSDTTKIIYQDNPHVKKCAQQIQEEIIQRWNISIPLEVEKVEKVEQTTPAASDHYIYLGVKAYSTVATALSDKNTFDFSKTTAQAYGLKANANNLSIIGNDDLGLYWGCQSLMMGLAWVNDNGQGTAALGLNCMSVLDWPDTIERALYTHNGVNTLFNMPQSEIPRIYRFLKLLSRYKINVLYINPNGGNTKWNTRYSWDKGALATIATIASEKYHLEIRPYFLNSEGEGAGNFKRVAKNENAWHLIDRSKDEVPTEIGTSINFNPLQQKSYSHLFNYFDEVLEQFGYPSSGHFFGFAFMNPQNGARWGASPDFAAQDQSADQLYAAYLRQLADYFRERKFKAVFASPALAEGAANKKDNRIFKINVDQIPEEIAVDFSGSTSAFTNAASLKAAAARLPYMRRINADKSLPSYQRIISAGALSINQLINRMGSYSGSRHDRQPLPYKIEGMWYGSQSQPQADFNIQMLNVFVQSFWLDAEIPSSRKGALPQYHPIDLTSVMNHSTHPTGRERLNPGYPSPLDLRYMKSGSRHFSGIDFDIIDPAQNNGSSVLMLGRLYDNNVDSVKKVVRESTPAIIIDKKLASVSVLFDRWASSTRFTTVGDAIVTGTCRITYADESWVIMDSMPHPNWEYNGHIYSGYTGIGSHCRRAWQGNAPKNKYAELRVIEWINPYPEKTIHSVQWFCPDWEDRLSQKQKCQLPTAIFAMTGIIATQHDIDVWKNRQRQPLYNKLIAKADPQTEIKGAYYNIYHLVGKIENKVTFGKEITAYTGVTSNKAVFMSYGRYVGVRQNREFGEFSSTITFDKALIMNRIEIIGPQHFNGFHDTTGAVHHGKRQKIDVAVECSEDGENWTQLGKLIGLNADADFQPILFSARSIKYLRFTADASAYNIDYVQSGKFGMFNLKRNMPHFAWRIFSPTLSDSPASQKE
ncbi:MAG: hypothetical protein HRU15_07325 [Planctomycetes bacterium]|nr:hypothetical protein [Planctomycetota bacterium]